MNKPIFSILTPTYNCSEFILRSYKSLQAQTNTDWEWVIVDDGSQDNTREIVCKIDDKRIKLHSYDINKGRGFARNFGIKNCSGEIIVVWDVDDIYLPDRLENIYKAIIIEKFDFMVSKAIVVDNSFNVKGIRGFFKNKLYRGFVHPTLAFKRTISQRFNYDIDMRAGEDLYLMIQLSNRYNGKYLDKNLMLYFEDREINLDKTILVHESHTATIHKVLNEKFVSVSIFKALIIKNSLFVKKMILKMFLLKPSLYLKTVNFRELKVLDDDNLKEILKMTDKLKVEYSNIYNADNENTK